MTSEVTDTKYCLPLTVYVKPDAKMLRLPEVDGYGNVSDNFWKDTASYGKMLQHILYTDETLQALKKNCGRFYVALSYQQPGYVGNEKNVVNLDTPLLGACPVQFCHNGSSFTASTPLEEHWEFCHQPLLAKFTCTKCDFIAIGYSALDRHLKNTHKDIAKDVIASDIVEESIPTRFYIHSQEKRYTLNIILY